MGDFKGGPRGPKRSGGFKGGEGRSGGFGRKPREGGFERRPREDGEGGERPRRSFGERKPYGDRAPRSEGGFSRGPRKDFGDRGPRRDYGDRKPRFDREEGDFRAERPTTHWVEKDPYETAPGSDGWLVGKHAVMAAITAGRRAVKEVWLVGDTDEVQALVSQFPEVKVKTVGKREMDERFPGQVHQGIAAEVGNLPQPDLDKILEAGPRLMMALDQVTDPHNFGAILRSCAAFGVAGVVATERRSAGVTSVVAKAAAGALEIVPVVEVTNLVTSLKQMQDAGYIVIGLEGEVQETVADLKLPADAKLCLVMGSEGEGLRRLTRETCNHLVRIPMSDAVESLNVSVAAGVILASLFRK